MTSVLSQIKSAFEITGMTPAEIAADQDLDITVVKAALMNGSSKYRKECGQSDESDLDFNNDELKTINKIIFEVATSAEHSDGSVDFKTRLAAATYIRDDKKGRKEARNMMAHNTFNILNLNERIQQARQMVDQMKGKLIEA